MSQAALARSRPLECRERAILESRYQADLNIYREVVAISESGGQANPELARAFLERAHAALKRHIAENTYAITITWQRDSARSARFPQAPT